MLGYIESIVANLSMSFEAIICFIAFVGGIIFYAKDFKLGVVLHLLFFGGIFTWFYLAGLNWTLPLIIMLCSLVLLVFSLFAIFNQKDKYGGFL